MAAITLSDGQQKAEEAFTQFILDPAKEVFVLAGFSGTGKSTLTGHLIENLPKILQTLKLIDPDYNEWEIQLTATTNKAAEALAAISGMDVTTIHSFLGLRVNKDYKTNKTNLVPRDRDDIKTDVILFIDEASYIDKALMRLIFQQTKRCKIVFMGDPAQLVAVKSSDAPVFTAGFPEARLTEVMRQTKGNPIIDVSTMFRHTVETGEWPTFTPDGHYIQHVDRQTFDQMIIDEFTDLNWTYNRSKVLAWTNKRVIFYNHAIRDYVKGNPEFHKGDYAVNNSFVRTKSSSLKTDQMVMITGLEDAVEYEVDGKRVQVDNKSWFFMPHDLADKKARLKEAQADNNYSMMQTISDSWIDLRAAYAQTVNKSQGSTYDIVFIDLDDIARCNSGNQIARMLYVAISRARFRVVLTGDLA